MNLLLDTHAFRSGDFREITGLWFIEGSAKLSPSARTLIEDEGNAKSVSAASLWEIAIKISLGRLRIEQPFQQLIPEQMEINGFALLPLRITHMARLTALPFHHRDPFDRFLAAQCLAEDLSLISIDAVFDDYTVRRLW
jgi:PIN domain nuclease of toxin-antitoxin system